MKKKCEWSPSGPKLEYAGIIIGLEGPKEDYFLELGKKILSDADNIKRTDNVCKPSLREGKNKYIVKYFYHASGMDFPDTHNTEVWADSPGEAIEKYVEHEYPEDIFYGPDNSYSSRKFLLGCLSVL